MNDAIGSDSLEEGDSEDEDAESDLTGSTASTPVPKTSRYLREMDRRVILERIAQGEKQATLAKEFNVSRAAICNLFKHRHEVLARSDENPFAKHPKKKNRNKPSKRTGKARARHNSVLDSIAHPIQASSGSLSGSTTTQSTGSSDSGLWTGRSSSGKLHVIKSAALPLLLSALSDRNRSLEDFRRNSERVLWLLLEEALALVPVRAVDHDLQATDYQATTYQVVSPPCAVSMEPQTVNATPMLDIFRLMEPQHPSATATVTNAPNGLTVEIPAGGLPQSLRGYNVFVLNVVAASGEAVCTVLERLMRQWGATEASLCVVSLFTSSEVVAMVQCKYPSAKIVTARIDSSITRRRIASTPVDLILHRMRQAYAASRP